MAKVYQLPKQFHPDFAVPNVKPKGPVEIDWDSSLTEGLVACWLFNNNITDKGRYSIRVTPNDGAVDDNFPRVYQGEQCWINESANGNNFTFDPGRMPLGASNRTIVARFNTTQTVEGCLIGWGDGGSLEEFTVTHDASGFIARLSGGAPAAAFGANNDGNWHTMALRAKGVSTGGADDFAYHVDGTRLTTTNIPSVTLATASTFGYFGQRGTATEGFTYAGYVSIALVFDGDIGEESARQLTLDPFQVLKPAVPMSYYVPAAAGGTTRPQQPFKHVFTGPFGGPI